VSAAVVAAAAPAKAAAPEALAGIFWARFVRHRPAVISAVVIALLGLASIFAGPIAVRDPLQIELSHKFARPLAKGHLMAVTVIVGAVLGTLAGYVRGAVDTVLLRLTDAMLSFPPIFMLLALAAFVRPSLASMTVIIAVTSWMDVTRMVRGQILTLREQEFVTGARGLGASGARIMARHLLPNTVGIIAVAATLSVARAILLESYISFLGYGIQPPLASWGNMLNNAQSYFTTAPWVAIFPGVMITLAVTSFNFLGDGLRDALDPRHVRTRT